MEDQSIQSWYLAQLKPNGSTIARRNLERQGFEVFLPMENSVRRQGSRFETRLRPLFPGYCFVAFNPARGGWRRINGTYGVARLVQFGEQPSEVPRTLVEGLIKRCDAEGRLQPPATVAPGDTVQFRHAPFAGFVGTGVQAQEVGPAAPRSPSSLREATTPTESTSPMWTAR